MTTNLRARLEAGLTEMADTARRTADQIMPDLERAATMVRETVRGGGTLFFCGNGGSAADAQHMATEYVVRYARNRRAYPAIALTTDTSLLTATGNDFGFDHVFSRQVEALARPGDLLVIHSTSGNSPNVLLAAEAARRKGVQVLAFSARDGGKLAPLADHNVIVPTQRTDRAQEVHLCVEHIICDIVEEEIAAGEGDAVIDLSGRRAVVTGGSRGIGAATARLLARCGADVVVGFRSRAADASQVVADVQGLGRRALAVSADLGEEMDAEAFVARAGDFLGGIDIFVGNAGIWPAEDIALGAMTKAHWRRTMRGNVDAMFYSTAAATRAMRDGGRIVLVASTAGQRGEAFHADYAASKGAMISFVKSLCIELAPRGITVNSVAPGWVDTEMTASVLSGAYREQAARNIPVGRIATPDDIAGPIVFLCSPHARHVTGEILNVNGGSVLCG